MYLPVVTMATAKTRTIFLMNTPLAMTMMMRKKMTDGQPLCKIGLTLLPMVEVLVVVMSITSIHR